MAISVLTFPNEYLRSEEEYLRFASLSPKGSVLRGQIGRQPPGAGILAVNGFLALRQKVEGGWSLCICGLSTAAAVNSDAIQGAGLAKDLAERAGDHDPTDRKLSRFVECWFE